MTNNITIADKKRIDILFAIMAKLRINSYVRIQKDSGFFWVVFEDEVSFVAMNNFVKAARAVLNKVEVDWDVNCVFIPIPNIF